MRSFPALHLVCVFILSVPGGDQDAIFLLVGCNQQSLALIKRLPELLELILMERLVSDESLLNI